MNDWGWRGGGKEYEAEGEESGDAEKKEWKDMAMKEQGKRLKKEA